MLSVNFSVIVFFSLPRNVAFGLLTFEIGINQRQLQREKCKMKGVPFSSFLSFHSEACRTCYRSALVMLFINIYYCRKED